MNERAFQDATLRRLNSVKRTRETSVASTIGPDLVDFYKRIEKQGRKFGKVGAAWSQLVPEAIQEHCALESFSRGSLTVLVDSSSHLYDLKHLLLAGLERQIILACKSEGLRKVALKAGQWYSGDGPDRKPRW
jgi:hypothetical protein